MDPLEISKYSNQRWRLNVSESVHIQFHKNTMNNKRCQENIIPPLKVSVNWNHLKQAHGHSHIPVRSVHFTKCWVYPVSSIKVCYIKEIPKYIGNHLGTLSNSISRFHSEISFSYHCFIYIYIYFDGATAPSGPGPSHYRGFKITLSHSSG
jgi:hypothetical protein